MKEIGFREVRAWMNHLYDAGKNPATINRNLATQKPMMKEAARTGQIPVDRERIRLLPLVTVLRREFRPRPIVSPLRSSVTQAPTYLRARMSTRITRMLFGNCGKKIDACRRDLDDTSTNTPGANVREAGRVENAVPLTVLHEKHPYIIAKYGKHGQQERRGMSFILCDWNTKWRMLDKNTRVNSGRLLYVRWTSQPPVPRSLRPARLRRLWQDRRPPKGAWKVE